MVCTCISSLNLKQEITDIFFLDIIAASNAVCPYKRNSSQHYILSSENKNIMSKRLIPIDLPSHTRTKRIKKLYILIWDNILIIFGDWRHMHNEFMFIYYVWWNKNSGAVFVVAYKYSRIVFNKYVIIRAMPPIWNAISLFLHISPLLLEAAASIAVPNPPHLSLTGDETACNIICKRSGVAVMPVIQKSITMIFPEQHNICCWFSFLCKNRS